MNSKSESCGENPLVGQKNVVNLAQVSSGIYALNLTVHDSSRRLSLTYLCCIAPLNIRSDPLIPLVDIDRFFEWDVRMGLKRSRLGALLLSARSEISSTVSLPS